MILGRRKKCAGGGQGEGGKAAVVKRNFGSPQLWEIFVSYFPLSSVFNQNTELSEQSSPSSVLFLNISSNSYVTEKMRVHFAVTCFTSMPKT